MQWLNYHHLLYFWTVAKEGGITRAAKKLHLSQPTLSSQLKRLEAALGAKLMQRDGRSMTLTEAGQQVFRYADEIFTLGRELSEAVKGHVSSDNVRLRVGIPDVLPKLIVYRLLQPALKLREQVQLTCFEGKLDALLGDLAMHHLDIVFADAPLLPQLNVRAFNHLLGESTITVCASSQLAANYRPDFPQSLHEAPMLLPTQNTSLRRALELWFDERQIRPRVSHEFEDSAILKVFGQASAGLFVTPTAIEDQVCRQYSVEVVGRIPDIKERFYAISIERRLKHPAVVAISRAAREKLFVSHHS
jgi:LysR family transcriptional activator of nhaA